MIRRFFASALAGGVALTIAACDAAKPVASAPAGNGAAATLTMPVDVGSPLYEIMQPKAQPTVTVSTSVLADPIVVRNCQVTLPQTQNTPSKNDGKLLEFCTEIPAGENVPDSEKVVHPRTKKVYKKLHESNFVVPNQLIAILDDTVAAAKFDVAVAGKDAAEAKYVAAEQLKNVALEEFNAQKKLKNENATTASDYRRALAQFDQSVAGIAEALGAKRKAEEEAKLANVELGEHEIRSTIPGMIKRFYRRPGESVKALEPVAEIQNLESLRIEGQLDYQFFSTISTQKDLKVIIEPAPQFGPQQYLEGHLQPVRAVAVSKDPSKPLIVSASDDKTVRVWDRLTKMQRKNFEHGVPVKAVACTGPQATENLCMTGADDGVPRLYNLDRLAPAFGEGESGKAEFKGRHSSQITSVAFAPNGKFCASADAQEIFLWDVTTGDLKYKFARFHKGPITYIQFTPLCMLVSESRDRTMAIWRLGTSGAKVEGVVDSRTGDVSVLSTNSDGTRVLFDQDRELHVLTTEKKTEGVMHAPSEATQFTGFALFSPDDRLVLASGTGDSPLQLWKAPQPGVRASLIRRLALPPSGMSLCGAFSADGSFAVTGTQDRKVLVWSMPTKTETDRVLTATVSLRDPTIDTDGKARFWAILSKPEGINLPAGATVTMVIPPAEGR